MPRGLAAAMFAAMAATASAEGCVPFADAAVDAGLTGLLNFASEVVDELPFDKDIKQLFPEFFIDTPIAEADRFTIFAPTNDAFESVSRVTSRLEPNDQLLVLLEHVFPGDLKVANVAEAVAGAAPHPFTTKSVADLPVEVFKKAGDFIVSPEYSDIFAKVVKVDIHTCIGTIHVIDSVLLPVVKPSSSCDSSMCQYASGYGDGDWGVYGGEDGKVRGVGKGGVIKDMMKGRKAAAAVASGSGEKADTAKPVAVSGGSAATAAGGAAAEDSTTASTATSGAGSASGTAARSSGSGASGSGSSGSSGASNSSSSSGSGSSSGGGLSGAAVGGIAAGAAAAVVAAVAAGVVLNNRRTAAAAVAAPSSMMSA